jgi:electron transport complex protein RnfC
MDQTVVIKTEKADAASGIRIPRRKRGRILSGPSGERTGGTWRSGFSYPYKNNPKKFEQVKTLIVNGAECEPFITSDYGP